MSIITPSWYRPSLIKAVMTFFLMVIFVATVRIEHDADDGRRFVDQGIPLPYYTQYSSCEKDQVCGGAHLFNVLVDLVVWYIVAALLVDVSAPVLAKVRRKRKRH
ncbi:MAG: hypothetical protein ABIH41_02910 [Nanoarchaeota archaeon]